MTTIEATQNSLKLSYLRFISDSAPGLLLLLALLVLDRNALLPIPIVPRDDTVKPLAAVIAFLLVTPIGLMINGISHFLLGGVQHWVARRCLSSAVWPVADTHHILLVNRWQTYFDVTGDNWPQIAYEVDDLLDTYVPHLAAVLEHVRALKKFFRSFALLALATVFVLGGKLGASAAGILLAIILSALFIENIKYRRAVRLFVVLAVALALLGCSPKYTGVAVSLCAIAVAAVLFAGLVEFYQYGSMMQFLYQLFSRSTEPRFKLSAETARDRLQDVVDRRRPMDAKGTASTS